MSIEILSFIRSLGTGSLFGAGLASLICFLWPGLFPSHPPIEQVAVAGALFGAAVHTYVAAGFDRLVAKPFLWFTQRFGRIIFLLLFWRLFTPEERGNIIRRFKRWLQKQNGNDDDDDDQPGPQALPVQQSPLQLNQPTAQPVPVAVAPARRDRSG